MRAVCTVMLGAWLSLGAVPAVSDTLDVIPLRYRSAEDLIPLLAPALQGEDTVLSGQGASLIVRGSTERVQQVRDAVRALDVAARRLLVSVRQTSLADFEHSGGMPGDAVGRYGTRRGEDVTQAVQVLDGGEAWLAVGVEVPQVQGTVGVTGDGFVVDAAGSGYRTATTGFYVRPRVSGEGVSVEIAPYSRRENTAGDGRFAVSALATTLSGRLGEWLPLGSSRQTRASRRDAVITSTRGQGSEDRLLLLKVDVLP